MIQLQLLAWQSLIFSFFLVALSALFALPFKKKISLSFLTLNLRAFFQLLLIGFILQSLFQNISVTLTLLYLLFMLLVAYTTGKGKLPNQLRWQLLFLFSLALSTLLALLYVLLLVLHLQPAFHPQYAIPLFGMLLSNTLNALTLFFKQILQEIDQRKNDWQTLLFLTSSPLLTFKPILTKSLQTALIPLFNYLAIVGIVQLPGLMTGQILSGIPPMEAIKYQILISLLITFSCGLSLSICAFAFPYLYLSQKTEPSSTVS